MNQLQSKPCAFVTGASYGVGAATALALARAGHNLVLSATKVANLSESAAAARSAGAEVAIVELDLSREDSIEAAARAATNAFGGVNVLVNNAGTNLRRLAVDVTRADWDGVMGPSLTGTFFLTQRIATEMIAGKVAGSIVMIASSHALIGAPERSTYGIAKAALVHMSRMLAVEWAPHGIRVNAVAPGRLITDSPSRQGSGSDSAYMKGMLSKIPLGRFATAEETAATVAFLAGPGAGSITGQTIVVDGGLTAT